MPSPATPPRVCRLCGSEAIGEWGRKRGRQLVEREFTFWKCRDCDVRFVEPVTGPEIYDEAYYAGRGVDPLVDYEAEYTDYRRTPRLEEFQGLAKVVTQYFAGAASREHRTSLHWFDYGCGAGGLMKFLTDRGTLEIGGARIPVAVSGFDIGSYADRLRMDDGLRVHTAESLAAVAPASFDVISLIEVLEHVEHPLDVLTAVSRWLKPGGLLLLTTGNVASPLATWQGIEFAYCIPEIHIMLWTPRALETAYARVGLHPYPVRCRGSIRFKVRKNLERLAGLAALKWLWLSPPLIATFDWMFGASAMPMAIKPVSRELK
jgi:2-polyprenyl-3-methyl-5-hydroxy-6-metoxy-1,4-benzoquinol methylase